MLTFCPTCANVLVVEEGQNCYRFACNTCPYVQNIQRKIASRKYPKLKEVDDVLGGAAAWENVDSTEETCPKCSHNRAFFMQIQTRSADEPMTTFYKCCNMVCAHRWRDWILCQCCDGLRTQTCFVDIGETVIHRAEDSIHCLNLTPDSLNLCIVP